jgi:hypothetical protein
MTKAELFKQLESLTPDELHEVDAVVQEVLLLSERSGGACASKLSEYWKVARERVEHRFKI